MINYDKLRQKEYQGIFDSGMQYQAWADWSAQFDKLFGELEKATCWHSNFKTNSKEYKAVFEHLKADPEAAVYLLIRGLTSGASYYHLILLREITGENPVPNEHAGRFLRQISDWLNWYCDIIEKDKNVV